MRQGATIAVVIPARDEEHSIGRVLAALPEWVDEVVVCDNGSTDGTADVARAHGARVVSESRRGYGSACLTALSALDRPDIVVFLDGDYSDHPEEMDRLVDPIAGNEADLVVGSRVRGQCAPGALTVQARGGNWLACRLLRWVWGAAYTDLGPFRAIRFTALKRLDMRDPNYGWTAEMQVKAAKHKLRTLEVPVSYRPRIGRSKISGTVRGVVGAGTKIIYTILAPALAEAIGHPPRNRPRHLIVFARYPEPGTTKTRLIPGLGAKDAARLSLEMTRHAIDWSKRLGKEPDVSVEVRFAGGSARRMARLFGRHTTYVDQGDGDLGDRLIRATDDAFAGGAARVVVVGTDCPALNEQRARAAFARLAGHDAVIGPAHDGGYYLIGLRKPIPDLFNGIAWGTGSVLAQTVALAERLGLSYALAETLHDVDTPDDVEHWYRVRDALAPARDDEHVRCEVRPAANP